MDLEFLNLKPKQDDGLFANGWNRGLTGGLLHAALYGTVIGLQVDRIDGWNTSFQLLLLFIMSIVQLVFAGMRILNGLFQGCPGTETGLVSALRNALSGVALISSYYVLGQEERVSSVGDYDAFVAITVLVTVAHVCNVLVNKDKPAGIDCPQGDNEKKQAEYLRLGTDFFLGASLVFLILHLANEDKSQNLFDERQDTVEGRSLAAVLILISVHGLLEGWSRFLQVFPGLEESVIRIIKFSSVEACDEELIPLNRVPIVRHLVTSSTIALLSLTYGIANNTSDVPTFWLLFALISNYLTDLAGRGIENVVA